MARKPPRPRTRDARVTKKTSSRPPAKAVAKPKRPPSRQAQTSSVAVTSPPPTGGNGRQAGEILARAEADISAAIDSLNHQMSHALTTLTELAVSQRGKHEAVIRTAPLDRATATFQRLVAEVVDEQLAVMLPPLIALRNEVAQRVREAAGDDDFHQRALDTLEHVLASAGISSFDARPGETFDPVIHLAVGEAGRPDLPDGAVAELLQCGFRSSRGKVLLACKVKVNRR